MSHIPGTSWDAEQAYRLAAHWDTGKLTRIDPSAMVSRLERFGGAGAAGTRGRMQGASILEHGKTRRVFRSKTTRDPIDFGEEPPLFAGGGSPSTIDRKRVSVQWFSGTILTGLCGAALMGGAVYAALDGEANFAAIPERVEATLRGTLGSAERGHATARKSDRLPPAGEINASRHIIRVSTTSRVGDREVVRVRPMIRVASNLALSTSDLTANLPPFNPAHLLTESTRGGAQGTDEGPGAEPDAEVSFITRDLAAVLPKVKLAATMALEDVIARVRDAAEWAGGAKPVPAVQPGTRLAYAATDRGADPYAGFEARIVPENVSLLPKSAAQSTGGNGWNERIVTLKKGETITSQLRDLGASVEDIKAVATVLGPRGRDGGLKEGQKLRILLSAAPGQPVRPIRVMVLGESAIEAIVALSDSGRYVPVDVRNVDAGVTEAEEEDDSSSVRLYQSVHETAMRNQIPRSVIDDLIRIYSYDVDFQRRVQPGDSFEVLFASEDENANDAAKGDVLFASLTVGGETKKYYRYQTSDDGIVDYYDETGKSAKKFLVRKPVLAGIMRSGFGLRRHPILGYSKMHTGVDWAAPHGTPIYASGIGSVEKVGWESGYGKYVRIRHTNGYETAYGHMSAFTRGMAPGTRVRQGQVIGYVGSTGLSTGAHLHYEIMVNGRFVDPMRIRLPRGRSLEGVHLAGFERERDRYDGIMNRPAPRVAQTAAVTR